MYLGEQDDDSPEAFELIHQAVKPQLTILDALSNGSVITISRCRPSRGAWEPLKAFFRRP